MQFENTWRETQTGNLTSAANPPGLHFVKTLVIYSDKLVSFARKKNDQR